MRNTFFISSSGLVGAQVGELPVPGRQGPPHRTAGLGPELREIVLEGENAQMRHFVIN